MDPDTGVDPVVLFRERQGGVEFFGTWPGADRQQRVNASRARALEHGFAVFGKLREVNVRVRVNQVHVAVYFSRAPTSTSSWKPASTGRPLARPKRQRSSRSIRRRVTCGAPGLLRRRPFDQSTMWARRIARFRRRFGEFLTRYPR